ncbi:MAG TPA: phosphoribosylaminoimidazolesuccinocarboxamide synthase [Candidatus Nitrosotenuis sp.]|nr:phosphoribosylaminoimidazolesuccinocarboxamide synthase [Candidatus Nitrosotenuis sp.]
MKFVGSGKVKDVYDLENGQLQFRFSDRVSAYDVKFHDPIPLKGEALCKFAEFWFNKLPVKNHYVRTVSKNEIIVKKMKMIPMECVVRGYFYGSLISRWKGGEIQLPSGAVTEMAAKLPCPIFDPTTKAEHDEPVTRESAVSRGLVTKQEFEWLESKSIEIYDLMSKIADSAGFILADLKLEFGKLNDEILLGDSIGPDEYRLWPKDAYAVGKIQESYDKQILRDWLTANGYQKQFEDSRKQGKEPVAPSIPADIINKMSERYVISYEKLTGKAL